ncbi:DeoR/GlpR family DNA-binding transcription regulator [Pseudokineococcus marinus]|uniref:Lactose phosphotransferase system repressor n=1 Tax=Pseudokineococcus marinus TaxID=351215 RepID=A0A849BUJ6_9ACTN|nr:DeoR/GlpR family DNA-binding transcription regulator [Pseudokineococcus marinus]NNH24617.1 DeoR/GlpR transcriptional regulator [Pseudokineococcus marinus]
MYAPERQAAIAARVARESRVSVTDLALEHAVTTETVRRDLAVLERGGALRRVHGGAVAPSALAAPETRVEERDRVAPEAKDRIAAAALAQLPPGTSSVALDAGSTTGRLAALLATSPGALVEGSSLVVVTHAVHLAARLVGVPGVELHLVGGRVRPTTEAAVGAETVRALEDLRVDVAVLGANGFSAEAGFTTPDAEEAAVKRALVRAARRVVVLADATKAGRQDLHRFARLEEVDVLVTDAAPAASGGELAALGAAGVDVVTA